jgi:mono/diheme cytochrome c family protein
MIAVLSGCVENNLARSAAISGLKGRELDFMRSLLANPAWQTESPGRTHTLALLARCITEERKPDRVAALLDLALASDTNADWQRVALLNGAAGIIAVPTPPTGSLAAEQAKIGAKPQGSTGLGRGFKPIKTDAEPPQLAKLSAFDKPNVAKLASKVSALFVWPGKPGYVEEKKVPPLTPAQEEFVAAGKQVYATLCVACHQPTGQGQEGLAPPIANSEWAAGPDGRLIRIVLQGVGGPMTVNGKDYSLDMPGLAAVLTDEQIAQVLSYVRRDFGNLAPVVETASVTAIRESTKDRGASWTADELESIH